jgi:hypothetical protein
MRMPIGIRTNVYFRASLCRPRWHYRYTVGNATETSVRSRFWQLYKAQGG